jgi:hypothetical protein
LHLVAVSGFVGGVVVNEFRRLSVSASVQVLPVRRSLLALMHGSFTVVLLTGLWLFLRDPLGMGMHTMFLPKLALICFGAVYAHFGRRGPALRGQGYRRGAALVSVVVWIGVVGFSTWNHVERPVNINAMLRATQTGRN